jgi:OmpA-OmpF porin, OOP family
MAIHSFDRIMQSFISRTTVFLFLILIGTRAAAQNNPMAATVNVILTNSKKQPLKGQEVLFTSGVKQRTGTTDASGRCSLRLPAGAVYTIQLKTMNDTTEYSTIDVPVLQPGQFFTKPFLVEIEYEAPRTFTLNNVHFDTGKPSLRPDSFKELDEIADYMKLKGDEKYEIAGHTDNIGKDEDNKKLSQSRAESVRNYLVKKGIDTKRLRAVGYGATQPVADNETSEGRQHNRRTEVVIL